MGRGLPSAAVADGRARGLPSAAAADGRARGPSEAVTGAILRASLPAVVCAPGQAPLPAAANECGRDQLESVPSRCAPSVLHLSLLRCSPQSLPPASGWTVPNPADPWLASTPVFQELQSAVCFVRHYLNPAPIPGCPARSSAHHFFEMQASTFRYCADIGMDLNSV